MTDLLSKIERFVGELARPFAIIATAVGVNVATVIIALKIGPEAGAAAIFIGAVHTGFAAIFSAKSWENSQAGKHTATVEIAKATPAAPRDDTGASAPQG